MFNHRSLLVACCISLTACANQSRVGTLYPVNGQSQDRVWFTGSSNIRHFTCSARQVNVSTEAALEDFARTKSDGLPAVKNAALQVPVRSLDCGIGLQNSHLFETLGASANPSITFVLSNYVVSADRSVQMNGDLRIAGVSRDVAIQARTIRAEDGTMMLTGEREIDVRDFGVQPPRRFFGLLRVRKEVTVHFLVTVRPLIDPLGILTASIR